MAPLPTGPNKSLVKSSNGISNSSYFSIVGSGPGYPSICHKNISVTLSAVVPGVLSNHFASQSVSVVAVGHCVSKLGLLGLLYKGMLGIPSSITSSKIYTGSYSINPVDTLSKYIAPIHLSASAS